MITLRFVVDKDFILQHILKSYTLEKDFVRLKKRIWDADKDVYAVLSQNLAPLVFRGNLNTGIVNATKHTKKNLVEIYMSRDFKKILRETEASAKAIQKEWEKNYAISVTYLSEITKIDISKISKEITVYLSHPKAPCGRSDIENKTIAWSDTETWKNYSTIYLWHEIFHHITFDIPQAPHLMHALIELACDNELRIKLNGGGKYFEEDGIPTGHRYLIAFEKKLLPDWKVYLKNPNENIYQFEKRMRRKYRDEKLARTFSELEEWGDWH